MRNFLLSEKEKQCLELYKIDQIWIVTNDSDMVLNIILRTPFRTSSRSATSWTGAGVGDRFASVGCGMFVPAGTKLRYSRTSPFNTRPCRPVAGTCARSTPFSLAILRTAGVVSTLVWVGSVFCTVVSAGFLSFGWADVASSADESLLLSLESKRKWSQNNFNFVYQTLVKMFTIFFFYIKI